MRNKYTVADIAIELMKNENVVGIDIGKYGLLDAIYFESLKRNIIKDTKHHPLDRQAYIMCLLRQSKKFYKNGYIDYPGMGRAYSKCSYLIYDLKEVI